MPEGFGQPVLTLWLLGACEVWVAGKPLPPLRYRKDLWLLALLTLRHEREVSRDELAALLWPDAEESQALYNLRRSLSNLRRALGSEARRLFTPSPRTLRLDLTEADCDLLTFDAALAQAAVSAAPDEPLQQAVALYRGPLLPNCLEEWALAERNLREQAYLAALERLARITQEKGEPTAAVHWLRLLLDTDPYRESACCALMQALSDAGDQAAVTQVYRDLRLRLRRDLNTEPAPETEALYQSLLARETRPAVSPPASPPPAGPPRRLPVPLSDLIGREQEVEEVGGWLGRSRLVTLVGAGGVGKTRLAIAAADAVMERFPEGTWFVDLAPLNDPTLLTQTLLRALDLHEEAHCTPEETLEQALASQRLLLVPDNCEHLLEACASLTYRLLSACPGLRVLATSREALGLTGEHIYRVPSLSLPPLGQLEVEKAASSLLEYAAVRLFVERAKQASPAFRLARSNAELVMQICQHLDGIPLALEMAAARLKALSVGQIAARLEDRFALLTGGSRAALPRQRTLQAAIDWSHDLLSEEERTLFRRLSVFAGGWTLEAAEAVCGGIGVRGAGVAFAPRRSERGGGEGESEVSPTLDTRDLTPFDVLDVLTHLVEKSLVVFEESMEGMARYRLLDSMRQYGVERLAESGEAETLRRRHADYFLAFAEEAGRRLTGPGQLEWSQRLEIEHDNLRNAIAWCRLDPKGVEAGLRLTSALAWFWATHGYLKEGQQHLAEALARESHSRTKARSEALNSAAVLACQRADYATAQLLYEECLAIRRELGDKAGLADTLTALGLIKHQQGDHATAATYLEERLALQQAAGERRESAGTSYWLGCILEAQGDLAKARFHLAAAHAIDLEFGHRAGHAAWKLGDVLCMQGDYAAARTLLSESLQTAWELGDKVLAMYALEHLAWLAYSQGQSERAVRLYGAADALRATSGYTLSLMDQNKHDARRSVVRAALSEAAFAAAWERGRVTTLDQMVEYALT